MTPEELRTWIRFGSSSPLYEKLVETIAEDPELLDVMNRIEHLPEPNLLLAGVQYLLMKDPSVALASHYPSLGERSGPEGELDALFREFVLSHAKELIEIGNTRYTQTNECRRCAVLLPLVWRTPLTRFHLVDVGASAGLNLQLDRYRYAWSELEWGPSSAVRLETENRGEAIHPRDIEIRGRTGLDLHPVNAALDDERLWLQALIWPEHFERRERLRAALDLAAEHPVDMIGGDALETISPILDSLPHGEPVVVMHSFALAQLDGEGRDLFRELLQDQRAKRPIHQIGFEAIGRIDGAASLTIDDGSGQVEVGLAHPHGEWVELYARP